MIVCTAGHVDHGKTSLVRALTGVDTDRLPEEKKRGMTIDLGFAYRGAVGFVDVPGHERFIHNMLAGVAAVDFALLVVAADDGPMPQTREHLAIVELLGIRRGAVALTKVDRVSRERAGEAAAEVERLLADTALAGSRIFPLDALQGGGVQPLWAHLEAEAARTLERRARGNFRLAVDRSFTVAGAGLVVTGTAVSGAVAVGDEVRLVLAGHKARVRGIHAHNAPSERGRAGQRLALNLAGLDSGARIARGDWVAAGAAPAPVRKLDARLRLVAGEALRHWTPVHMHIGAQDVPGRVALLDAGGLVQLVLAAPVGAACGDRFIVRDQSARRTLGGGTVIDLFPPPRGRARPERLAWLAAMEEPQDDAALAALLELAPAGVDMARFAANRNLPAQSGLRFSPRHWSAAREKALAALSAWHAARPAAPGMPENALRVPAPIVESLVAEGKVLRHAGALRLASHQAQLGAADAALWRSLEPRLAGTRPPGLAELSAATGADARKLEAALARIAQQGLAVRVSKARFFLPAPLAELERVARELAAGGALTAAAFRDRTGIGRNLAIEVLEYFDRIKLTRRVGDARVLVAGSRIGRETHPGGAHGLQIR